MFKHLINKRTLMTVTIACATVFSTPIVAQAGIDTKQQIVSGNTSFALALYDNLKSTPGNLFLSPYSISTALAMTYFGARENTSRQMASVLDFRLEHDELLEAFSLLQTDMNMIREKGKVRLNIANSLWAEKTYPFLDSFIIPLREKLQAELRLADFINDHPAVRLAINAWVEKQTNEKITNLIQPEVLNKWTTLVLVNAIYFMGDWETPFDKDVTQDAPFYILPDRQTTIPMMKDSRKINYMETGDLQIAELPYAGGDLSMVILLPGRIDGLEALEGTLNASSLEKWLTDMQERQVTLYLPRFAISSEFNLADNIAMMGMPDAFSGTKADFSGIDGSRNLFISAIIHKAVVDVSEIGTEAAAATAVVMMRSSFDPRPIPIFQANRPFIFLIRENQSGNILFVGRLVTPSTGQ